MKKQAKLFVRLLAVFFALGFCACAANRIHSQYSSPDFSISDLKGAKSLLVVSDQIDVRDFRRSFARIYKNGSSFSRNLSRTLADSLNQSGEGFSVVAGSPPDTLSGFGDSSSLKDVKYLLNVKNIVIDETKIYTAGVYAPSSPNGGMMMTGGGTAEYCILSYEVEIRDVKTGERKASFAVSGEASVFLFFYQSALENAVWKSTVHLIAYLRYGKTEF